MKPYKITVHEFGKRNPDVIVMFHPLGVRMPNVFTDTLKFMRDDLLYGKIVLSGMSSNTIWRAFYFTNNYSMPESVFRSPCPVRYWDGEAERSARKRDIASMKKVFPDTVFVENKGQDHAESFTLHPEAFCDRLETSISNRHLSSADQA